MSQAVNEMSHYNEYDFIVVNDDFDTALQEMASIFQAMRSRNTNITQKHSKLINDLLSIGEAVK